MRRSKSSRANVTRVSATFSCVSVCSHANQINDQIRVQIEEAVYFLFTWTEGTFNFEPDLRPEMQDFLVSIRPDALLLEGARRVDEWSLIEKKIPDVRHRLRYRSRTTPRKRRRR